MGCVNNRSVRHLDKRHRSLIIGSVVSLCLLTGGCNLVSDAKLKDNFNKNHGEFDKLIAMAKQDQEIRIIFADGHVELKGQNYFPSQQRLSEYRALFQKLGIRESLIRDGKFPVAIFLRVECTGSAIDYDCKGYAYSEEPLSPIKSNLNDVPMGIAFEPLAGNWYLFRMSG
jgi:hypothetical protein